MVLIAGVFKVWGPYILAGATLITLFFGNKALPAIRAWGKRVLDAILFPFNGSSRIIKNLQATQDEISKKISYIADQMTPNGGASLRDAVNRLEKSQKLMSTRLSYFFDNSDPMFETDSAGLCTWVSKSYIALTGRSYEDLLNWGWTLSVHPADLDAVRDEWRLAVAEKRTFEYSYRIVHVDKKVIRVTCKAIPSSLHNNIIGWVGIITKDENGST